MICAPIYRRQAKSEIPLIMKGSSISNTLSAEGFEEERVEAIKVWWVRLLESTNQV